MHAIIFERKMLNCANNMHITYRVLLPGSGSDFAPFRDRVGAPVSQIRFTFDPVMFLAHLSRRLKGDLIVYQSSCRLCVCLCVCESVCLSVCKHFLT